MKYTKQMINITCYRSVTGSHMTIELVPALTSKVAMILFQIDNEIPDENLKFMSDNTAKIT